MSGRAIARAIALGGALALLVVAASYRSDSDALPESMRAFLTARGETLGPLLDTRWDATYTAAFIADWRDTIGAPSDESLFALRAFATSNAPPEARALALFGLRRWAPAKLEAVARIESADTFPPALQSVLRGARGAVPPPSGLHICEFMASSYRNDGAPSPDWIEIHNSGTTPIDLAGWTFSDDSAQPGRWALPDGILQPGARVLVSSDNETMNFRLAASGEFLGLFTPEGALGPATSFYPVYPQQRVNVSYGVVEGETRPRYFAEPTPGAPNTTENSYTGIAPSPELSHASAVRTRPVDVTLSVDERGAVVRYTLDGSSPHGGTAATYTGPIAIAANTVLRAITHAPGMLPSDEVSATYLVQDAVLNQTAPEDWPTHWGEGGPADYEMDPEIVGDPANRQRIARGLRGVPTLSIAVPLEALFDETTGIYTHPEEDGMAWEREARIELFDEEDELFSTVCGLRIQGRSSRYPETTPKHSFRVAFRARYGDATLDAPGLFREEGPDEFNTLVLRATSNHSWLYPRGEQRQKAQYIRDVWMKDTQRAMGAPAPRCRYVNLYLNGVYWGLYVISERPDDAYMASRFGGAPEDYDVIKGGEVVAGDDRMWRNVLALSRGTIDAEDYARIEEVVDLDNFIDYLILNHYAGNDNWDFGNWYAARPKDGSHGFRFFAWDGENVFKRAGDNAFTTNHRDRGTELFHNLRNVESFRDRFARRVAMHTTGEGALTPEAATTRFLDRAREIDHAITAESARWGDYRRDITSQRTGPYELYTRDDWLREQAWLVDEYFPQRTQILRDQYKSAGLVP